MTVQQERGNSRALKKVLSGGSQDEALLACWQEVQASALCKETSAVLGCYVNSAVLQRCSYSDGLSNLLACKLADSTVSSASLQRFFADLLEGSSKVLVDGVADLWRALELDPACQDVASAFLFYKGFHALQTYRIANCCWVSDQKSIAYWLQNRASVLFGVDIHPAATIGRGIFIDHATGIVIGETSVVGDRVSLFHGVTLGGRGLEKGDRHPKVSNDVTISANATVLGNISIGEGSVIGACSVVLKDVGKHSRVVGNPARSLSRPVSQRAGRAPENVARLIAGATGSQ